MCVSSASRIMETSGKRERARHVCGFLIPPKQSLFSASLSTRLLGVAGLRAFSTTERRDREGGGQGHKALANARAMSRFIWAG